MKKITGKKGLVAEEAIRNYFLGAGYYVVRGIPLNFRGYDVTDVDLWLYIKTSSLTSVRACVDIKYRKTPAAMERVLWTKGLKEILKLDQAIIVTTDDRAETRDFGAMHGVVVMQGGFLKKTIDSIGSPDRLTEEEMFTLLKTPCVVDPRLDWRVWFRRLKARLLNSNNFDGCNIFIVAIKTLFDEYVATSKTSEVSVRMLYTIISYFLVCLDYNTRSFVQLDEKLRGGAITDGIRYGESGRERAHEILKMSLQLLSQVGEPSEMSPELLQKEVKRQLSEYNAEILGEHYGKMEQLKNVFANARVFEKLGYSKTLSRPHELATDQKALIGLLCDLLKQDRKEII